MSVEDADQLVFPRTGFSRGNEARKQRDKINVHDMEYRPPERTESILRAFLAVNASHYRIRLPAVRSPHSDVSHAPTRTAPAYTDCSTPID